MKKKKMFKNKTQMIIYIILFIILIGLFIYIGQINFQIKDESDAEKFSSLYNLVPNDNLYEFADATDVIDIINGRSGVILFAFPDNEWSNYYAKILNEAAQELEMNTLYYYDFEDDRRSSNGTYETIVNKLKVYVPVNDENVLDIYAPTVLIVKNGKILGYFDDTSLRKGTVTPEIYYTENQTKLTYEGFKTALKEYLKQVKYGRKF